MALTDEEKETAKFLERDFNQCFQQMRHYDGQIIEIVKFAVTSYAAIAGGALALYKYGLEKKIDFSAPALLLVAVGFLFGVTLLALVVRNRTYFVLVTRYLNEHRAFFLVGKPLGFKNAVRMYTNHSQPPYFNWRSSQTLLLNALAVLNASLVGLGGYLLAEPAAYRWCIVVVLVATSFLAQLIIAIKHLRSREGKSAGHAVFGKD